MGVLKYLRELKFNKNDQSPPSTVHEMSNLITWHCINFMNHLTLGNQHIPIAHTDVNGPKETLFASRENLDSEAKILKMSMHQIYGDVLNKMVG